MEVKLNKENIVSQGVVIDTESYLCVVVNGQIYPVNKETQPSAFELAKSEINKDIKGTLQLIFNTNG